MSKGRDHRAYRMVFGHKVPEELLAQEKEELSTSKIIVDKQEEESVPFGEKVKKCFSEFSKLYGPPLLRKRAIICHFVWCVTSLCYYVTALNVVNLKTDKIVYVSSTGVIDIISYLVSMVALKYLGRRSTSCGMFMFSGLCLLSILAIPRENTLVILGIAMLGRLGITAVYAVLTLHTAELFPTEIRNSALGICSTMAHVGSIAAPYIVDLLGQIAWFIPTTICGFTILSAGLLTLLHPETRHAELKDHAHQETGHKNNKNNMELKS